MSWGQTTTSGSTLSQMTSQSTSRMAYGRPYTPLNNENITSIRVNGRNSTGSASAGLLVGIYDITSGRVGAPLVHSVTVPITISASAQWFSVSTSFALSKTKTYAYAFVAANSAQWEVSRQTTSSMLEQHSTTGTFTNPTPWASGTASTLDALVEVVTVSAGSTINTINGSAFGAVKAGSTGNTVTTTSSFTPTSGTHGGKAISAIAGSAGSYTFTSANYVDGQTFPEPDTNQTFTLTDGVESISAISAYSSPDSMTSVVLSSPDTGNNKNITFYIPTASDGDRIVFPTEGGNFNIAANGSGTALNAGPRTLWHWNSSDSIMTQIIANIAEGGAVISVTGLTQSGLTTSGLTISGLTKAGL